MKSNRGVEKKGNYVTKNEGSNWLRKKLCKRKRKQRLKMQICISLNKEAKLWSLRRRSKTTLIPRLKVPQSTTAKTSSQTQLIPQEIPKILLLKLGISRRAESRTRRRAARLCIRLRRSPKSRLNKRKLTKKTISKNNYKVLSSNLHTQSKLIRKTISINTNNTNTIIIITKQFMMRSMILTRKILMSCSEKLLMPAKTITSIPIKDLRTRLLRNLNHHTTRLIQCMFPINLKVSLLGNRAQLSIMPRVKLIIPSSLLHTSIVNRL